MSKKTKALEFQLSQAAQENAELRSRLAMAEKQLKDSRDEVNNTMLELSNAKRKLDDFRIRQEAIVNALTEAHNTRDRLIKEAKVEADAIEAEAKSRRTSILSEAKETLEHSAEEASKRIEDANKEAERIIAEAEKDAHRLSDEAVEEADNVIELANAQARKILDDAENAVTERREQLEKLNAELCARAELALKQTEIYADILNAVGTAASANDLPRDTECACSGDCRSKLGDAGDDCALGKDAAAVADGTAERAESREKEPEGTGETVPPCGRNTRCCAAGRGTDSDDSGINAADAPDSDVESAPDEENRADAPESYDSVASLMKNIYTIEGRELPDVDTEAFGDDEGRPLSADEGGDWSRLPVDNDLQEILNEIMPQKDEA